MCDTDFNISLDINELENNDKNFSKLLLEISKCPKKLYCVGNLELLSKDAIAIVGSRSSTEYGRKMTKELIEDLVKNDIVIVSGLAKGIDSVAHKTCLDNYGKTIAVLGTGLDNIYPKENEELFYRIIENDGLVISEIPVNSRPSTKNFPMRNRIISGLSLATVVIEAAYRSGTSITASFAKSQGRKVFCIPNCIGNKNSRGTLDLLKRGATMVQSAKEILEYIGFENIKEIKTEIKKLSFDDDISKKIFDVIYDNEKINAEGISTILKKDVSIINEKLSYLELENYIENVGFGGYKVNSDYYK